jgi:hypothetical protein
MHLKEEIKVVMMCSILCKLDYKQKRFIDLKKQRILSDLRT